MRLIDADALLFELANESFPQSCTYAQGRNGVIESIRNAPTIDAVPVRHGRWVEQGLSPYEGTRRCSICESYYDIKEQFNYCPNCGARMDGESDE